MKYQKHPPSDFDREVAARKQASRDADRELVESGQATWQDINHKNAIATSVIHLYVPSLKIGHPMQTEQTAENTFKGDIERLRALTLANPDPSNHSLDEWLAEFPKIPRPLLRSLLNDFNINTERFLAPRWFDPSIWFQVSRSYRSVARLPEGMTGIQALVSKNPDRPDWANNMGEGHAGDHFLRCHARATDGLLEELSFFEWETFKAAGGLTYDGWHYQKQQKVAEEAERMAAIADRKSATLHVMLWSDKLVDAHAAYDVKIATRIIRAYAARLRTISEEGRSK